MCRHLATALFNQIKDMEMRLCGCAILISYVAEQSTRCARLQWPLALRMMSGALTNWSR
jgi:hypothetical protein